MATTRRRIWPWLFLGVIAALIVGGVAFVRNSFDKLEKNSCTDNLRGIAIQCAAYAADHGGAYPPDTESLHLNYSGGRIFLSCYAAHRAGLNYPHYRIVCGLTEGVPGNYICAYDNTLQNHHFRGRNVLFLDGHVEWWPAKRDWEFQARLDRQRKEMDAKRRKVLCPPMPPREDKGRDQQEEAKAVKAAFSVLAESEDPEQLQAAAISLCESKDKEVTRKLTAILRDPDFHKRLGTDKDSKYTTPDRLRIRHILSALAKSPSPYAGEAFVELSRDKEFVGRWPSPDSLGRLRCLDSLIVASSDLPEVPPEFLQFLDAQANPGGASILLAMMALAKVGSPDAWRIIEKHVLSPKHWAPNRSSWLLYILVFRRNEPPVVAIYKKLLQGEIADVKLRNRAVETLFDFDLRWYREGTSRRPPAREEASTEVLTEVLECAGLALKLDIPEKIKEKVRSTQKEIESILLKRKEQQPPAKAGAAAE